MMGIIWHILGMSDIYCENENSLYYILYYTTHQLIIDYLVLLSIKEKPFRESFCALYTPLCAAIIELLILCVVTVMTVIVIFFVYQSRYLYFR